jgi:hypothetical protein
VLASHLAEMARRCREAGATPFLVTYPFRAALVDEARDVAIALEPAAVIDAVPRFDELLRTVPRDALFVGDGHCTARGYDELAAVVAAALERSGALR